jgi:hypothetical protein
VTAQNKLDASQQTLSDAMQYTLALAEGVAIINAKGWTSEDGRLSNNLRQFESDASQLNNGDLTLQRNVTSDIATLAADCGVAGNGS